MTGKIQTGHAIRCESLMMLKKKIVLKLIIIVAVGSALILSTSTIDLMHSTITRTYYNINIILLYCTLKLSHFISLN